MRFFSKRGAQFSFWWHGRPLYSLFVSFSVDSCYRSLWRNGCNDGLSWNVAKKHPWFQTQAKRNNYPFMLCFAVDQALITSTFKVYLNNGSNIIKPWAKTCCEHCKNWKFQAKGLDDCSMTTDPMDAQTSNKETLIVCDHSNGWNTMTLITTSLTHPSMHYWSSTPLSRWALKSISLLLTAHSQLYRNGLYGHREPELNLLQHLVPKKLRRFWSRSLQPKVRPTARSTDQGEQDPYSKQTQGEKKQLTTIRAQDAALLKQSQPQWAACHKPQHNRYW